MASRSIEGDRRGLPQDHGHCCLWLARTGRPHAHYFREHRQRRFNAALSRRRSVPPQNPNVPDRSRPGARRATGRTRQTALPAVPKAAVVITNPTHYAVALQYERGMEVPVCVAKGVEALALKIREVAGAHSIPIVENPPLARGARHRRGRSGDPDRALQGGGRGGRLRHAASPGGASAAPESKALNLRDGSLRLGIAAGWPLRR